MSLHFNILVVVLSLSNGTVCERATVKQLHLSMSQNFSRRLMFLSRIPRWQIYLGQRPCCCHFGETSCGTCKSTSIYLLYFYDLLMLSINHWIFIMDSQKQLKIPQLLPVSSQTFSKISHQPQAPIGWVINDAGWWHRIGFRPWHPKFPQFLLISFQVKLKDHLGTFGV